MLHAAVGGKALFKLPDLRAIDEHAVVEDAGDGSVEVGTDGGGLPLNVQERNRGNWSRVRQTPFYSPTKL